MKVFVIDLAKCNGCYACQIVCKDEHVDNDWSPYAKPQPTTGQFWMKVAQKTVGSVPKVRVNYTPTPCMHCDNPSCVEASNGAVYKRPDGLVIIDPERAQGQKQIVEACPYGVIYWNDSLNIPQKCTGCAHLVDLNQTPRCVEACATDAIKFGEEDDLKDLIAKAEVMQPESGCRPRVYYLNMPKNFVAGEVWDPSVDECLEGTAITLTATNGGKKLETTSDEFGDFWFRKLEDGEYTLKIEKDGYFPFEIPQLSVSDSVNIGDVALKLLI